MASRAALLPARRHPVEYRRLVVPLADGQSEQVVHLACSLAAEHGSSVTAVSVVEVPPELPLAALMLEEETAVRRMLAQAQAVGDLYGVDVRTLVLRARSAGPRIVELAEEEQAELIVLPAPRKRRVGRRAFAFGATVAYVLRHAPCRVLMAAPPLVR